MFRNNQTGCSLYARLAVCVPLLATLISFGGCTTTPKHSVAEASTLSYFPHRSATDPRPATPFQVEPCYYGYHGTCWRPWPEQWRECSDEDFLWEETSEGLPAPQAPGRPLQAAPHTSAPVGPSPIDDQAPAPPQPSAPANLQPAPGLTPPAQDSRAKEGQRLYIFGAHQTRAAVERSAGHEGPLLD